MSSADGGNPEREQMQDVLQETVEMVTLASFPTHLWFFSPLLLSCRGRGNERQTLIPSSLPSSQTPDLLLTASN